MPDVNEVKFDCWLIVCLDRQYFEIIKCSTVDVLIEGDGSHLDEY